jgi:transposase-like protein
LTELVAFKGKYRERYPEAVRSLCEDEEHLLTFYAFPQAMHRHIRSTNAIESFFRNVRPRSTSSFLEPSLYTTFGMVSNRKGEEATLVEATHQSTDRIIAYVSCDDRSLGRGCSCSDS